MALLMCLRIPEASFEIPGGGINIVLDETAKEEMSL
jgi:hypothetical protein